MACGPDEDVDAVVVVDTTVKDEGPPPPPPEPFFLFPFFCTTTGTGDCTENEPNSLTGDWKMATGELDMVAEQVDVDEDDLLDVDTSWTSVPLIEKLGCRLPVRELDGELSVDVDNVWSMAVLDKEDMEGRRWCSLLVRGEG